MDVETRKLNDSSGPKPSGRRKRRRRSICLAVIALILLLGIILLILGLTLFKAKRPVTNLDSVSLQDFNLSLDILRLRVILNVSLDASLRIKNPNRVGFKFSNSSALLKYRGEVVGEVPIPAGQIGARQTRSMNFTLTLMADRLLSNSQLYSDAISGSLPFTTYARIPGHVRFLFKIRIVSYTTCDLNIDIMNRNIANQTCHYRTKI